MTESVPAPTSSTSWRTVNIVLVLLALVLVAATVVFVVQGERRKGGGSHARQVSGEYRSVLRAAEAETVAFLHIDYRRMDSLMDKVVAGATGSFKSQYSGAKANLKSTTQSAQAVSTGKVRSSGISDLDTDSAVVFVAADSQVVNKSTKGKAQPRYYRLKLTMKRQGSSWLTSDLQFVG